MIVNGKLIRRDDKDVVAANDKLPGRLLRTRPRRLSLDRTRTREKRIMIHVIAIITAKPGKRDEILKNFKANVPAVHAEKGCIEYGATVDTDGGPFAKFGPDTFVVIEKWESMDDLKAHGASAHMKAYGEKNKDLVANRAVHVLQNA